MLIAGYGSIVDVWEWMVEEYRKSTYVNYAILDR
jgi:hypothetical protein